MSVAVVSCVNTRQRILLCKVLIKPGSSKIFADMLQRIAECFSNPARRPGRGQKFRSVGHGPQSKQRLNTRDGTGPGSSIRHKSYIAQTQILPETLVISEQECLVLPDRPTERTAKLIALKLRDRAMVEEIPGVQCAI